VWASRKEIVKAAKGGHDRVVILGDFNAHLHKLHVIPFRAFPLHNPRSEINGTSLADLLNDRRLVILNGRIGLVPPCPTRYPPQKRSRSSSSPKPTMLDHIAVGADEFKDGLARDLRV
jgi:hypothetical protein